jgi:hypothetical protein
MRIVNIQEGDEVEIEVTPGSWEPGTVTGRHVYGEDPRVVVSLVGMSTDIRPAQGDRIRYRTARLGEPCTIYVGSDSYAADVVHVSPAGAYVMVQTRGRPGRAERFSRRQDGRYVARGKYLGLGVAKNYSDPSF